MTTQPVLNATARDRGGKGAARQARRDGLVPGVIYGGKQPAQMVSFNAREFGLFFNRTPDLASTVIEVKLDGESIRVLARDVQLHPVTDVPLHVDLLRLTGDHEIRGVEGRLRAPIGEDHQIRDGDRDAADDPQEGELRHQPRSPCEDPLDPGRLLRLVRAPVSTPQPMLEFASTRILQGETKGVAPRRDDAAADEGQHEKTVHPSPPSTR